MHWQHEASQSKEARDRRTVYLFLQVQLFESWLAGITASRHHGNTAAWWFVGHWESLGVSLGGDEDAGPHQHQWTHPQQRCFCFACSVLPLNRSAGRYVGRCACWKRLHQARQEGATRGTTSVTVHLHGTEHKQGRGTIVSKWAGGVGVQCYVVEAER